VGSLLVSDRIGGNTYVLFWSWDLCNRDDFIFALVYLVAIYCSSLLLFTEFS
jgi:hypothetical protein